MLNECNISACKEVWCTRDNTSGWWTGSIWKIRIVYSWSTDIYESFLTRISSIRSKISSNIHISWSIKNSSDYFSFSSCSIHKWCHIDWIISKTIWEISEYMMPYKISSNIHIKVSKSKKGIIREYLKRANVKYIISARIKYRINGSTLSQSYQIISRSNASSQASNHYSTIILNLKRISCPKIRSTISHSKFKVRKIIEEISAWIDSNNTSWKGCSTVIRSI